SRLPRPSVDVARSQKGARGATCTHVPSHRRAGRPVSLAGGIGRAPPIAMKTRSSTVRYAEKATGLEPAATPPPATKIFRTGALQQPRGHLSAPSADRDRFFPRLEALRVA